MGCATFAWHLNLALLTQRAACETGSALMHLRQLSYSGLRHTSMAVQAEMDMIGLSGPPRGWPSAKVFWLGQKEWQSSEPERKA